jgi:hypothetical protein
LVAGQNRQLFAAVRWKGDRVDLTPVDCRIDGAGDRQHRRCDIDTNDPTVESEPLASDASDYAGATCDIDMTLSPR